jgi:hypothetical protein
MMAVLPAAIAISVAWLALTFLRRPGCLPVDRPNDRSLHRSPVPRGAGLAIWAGVIAGTVWLPQPQTWLAPLLLVIAMSLWDDQTGVPVALRLTAQIVAAFAWIGFSKPLTPALPTITKSFGWRIFTFMDGSDGLAAAMSITGYGAYAVAAWRRPVRPGAVVLAVVAATVPFSCLTGRRRWLLSAMPGPSRWVSWRVLGIGGWRAHWWPAWFPLLVFRVHRRRDRHAHGRAISGARVWRPIASTITSFWYGSASGTPARLRCMQL